MISNPHTFSGSIGILGESNRHTTETGAVLVTKLVGDQVVILAVRHTSTGGVQGTSDLAPACLTQDLWTVPSTRDRVPETPPQGVVNVLHIPTGAGEHSLQAGLVGDDRSTASRLHKIL